MGSRDGILDFYIQTVVGLGISEPSTVVSQNKDPKNHLGGGNSHIFHVSSLFGLFGEMIQI